jgi:DNA-binding transcriptional LysR family regulator
MDKLRALEYFVAAAQAGSFAGAARQLDVSVPSIHKLIAALEAQLGARLFERTHKGLTLTASGDTYLESCRPLLDELAALDRVVSRAAHSPSGTLVIGAPSQLTHHLLMPALPRFRAMYPDIQIDFRVVQRPADGEGAPVDVFVLHGWPEAQNLIHRRLGRAKTVVAATPAYWARHGVPHSPGELAGHACLLVRNPAGILIDLWDFERGADRLSVKVSGWLSSTDREVILNAVMAGEGVGRFSELSTRGLLQCGRLVPVLADWEVQGGPPLNVLYRASHRRTPRVRAFLAFLDDLLEQLDAGAPAGEQPEFVDLPQWHRRGYGRASSVLRSRL